MCIWAQRRQLAWTQKFHVHPFPSLNAGVSAIIHVVCYNYCFCFCSNIHISSLWNIFLPIGHCSIPESSFRSKSNLGYTKFFIPTSRKDVTNWERLWRVSSIFFFLSLFPLYKEINIGLLDQHDVSVCSALHCWNKPLFFKFGFNISLEATSPLLCPSHIWVWWVWW